MIMRHSDKSVELPAEPCYESGNSNIPKNETKVKKIGKDQKALLGGREKGPLLGGREKGPLTVSI